MAFWSNATPPLLIVHSIVAFVFVIQDLVTVLGSSIAAIIPPKKKQKNSALFFDSLDLVQG